MKNLILGIAVIAVIGLTSCKNGTQKGSGTASTETAKEMTMTNLSFGVRGNCVMCEKSIEKAANSVQGVSSANWDVNKKKIEVSFDKTKTDEMSIHKAIAASGYDTDKVSGNDEAYKKLPGCCQYDRKMMMNQSREMDEHDHANHNH